MYLQFYIPSEYEIVRDFIEKMKFQDSTWGNEVMIFDTMQIIGKYIVIYTNGDSEWHCARGTF